MIRTLGARLMAAVIGLGLMASPAPAQAARWVESFGDNNDFHIIFSRQPEVRCGLIITTLCDYRITTEPWGAPTIEQGSGQSVIYSWSGPVIPRGQALKLNMNLDYLDEHSLLGVVETTFILDAYWTIDGRRSDWSTPRFRELPPGSPTPEPAAWALMILGLGAAGARLRRRRNREAQEVIWR